MVSSTVTTASSICPVTNLFSPIGFFSQSFFAFFYVKKWNWSLFFLQEILAQNAVVLSPCNLFILFLLNSMIHMIGCYFDIFGAWKKCSFSREGEWNFEHIKSDSWTMFSVLSSFVYRVLSRRLYPTVELCTTSQWQEEEEGQRWWGWDRGPGGKQGNSHYSHHIVSNSSLSCACLLVWPSLQNHSCISMDECERVLSASYLNSA